MPRRMGETEMAAIAVNRQILLAEAPKSKLGPEHFKLTEGETPKPADGKVLVPRAADLA
jgi:NADPH-dependent curcumin reductase CurA